MAQEKVGVAILGTGRSGTSAVTRMFVSAGFFAGLDGDLMEATEANPTGHWENLKIFGVNERILSRLGGNWVDPPSEARQVQAQGWATPELRAALDEIKAQAVDAPIVVKDPRIGMMLPIWGGILEEQLHPVLVIRDPIEIARSLRARDGTPTSFTLAIWQLHMSFVLHYLRGHEVTIAPYGPLLGSGHAAEVVVRSTLKHLDRDAAGRIVSAPIPPDPELRRNHASPADYEQQMSIRQFELWKELARLPPGDHRLDVSEQLLDCAPAVLDLVRAETERHAAWKREQAAYQAVADERKTSESLSRELASERERLGTELLARRAEREATAEELRLANGYLEDIQRSLSWRATAPLRAVKRQVQRRSGAIR